MVFIFWRVNQQRATIQVQYFLGQQCEKEKKNLESNFTFPFSSYEAKYFHYLIFLSITT